MRFAALLIAQLTIALLLVEAGLRLLRPRHDGLRALLYIPSHRTVFDRIDSLEDLLNETVMGFIPYEQRRGFVLNSRSFRTPEYTGPKEDGVYRVLCLGDSFTFASGGVPFAQGWTVQLESQLNRLLERPVEVYSLGVPGVGPRFELRLWELEHRLVRADLVVLAFFIGNDFTDERKHGLEPWIESRPAKISYTWRALRNTYRLWDSGWGAAGSRRESQDGEPNEIGGFARPDSPEIVGPARSNPARHLNIEAGRLQICAREQRGEFLRISADVAEVLQRLAIGVRASGASLMVMMVPDVYQVDQEVLHQVLHRAGLGSADIDLDFPQARLRQLLEEREIPYLDLLPLFRQRANEEMLYWPNNSHWNIEGNILAGKTLAAHLRRTLLADERGDGDLPSAGESGSGE